MYGADEFICRDSVVLKCEAVALLVGHRSLIAKNEHFTCDLRRKA